MGAFTNKNIVLIPFPFSDLSHTKLRPAVILASLDRGDHILCQITSKPYADPLAIEINNTDFAQGSLAHISYARPGKLFTANESLFLRSTGSLKDNTFAVLRDAVITIFRQE